MRGRVGWGHRREVAGVGDEGLALAPQRLFDHGMPAGLDGEAERGIDLGADIIVVDRELGKRGCDIEQREGMRGVAQIVARGERLSAEPVEDLQFEVERALAGIGDLGFGLASSAVVKRTWPASVWRWMKIAFSGGDISLSPCCAVTSTK